MPDSSPVLALPNISGDCFVLDEDLFQKGIEASRHSPRKRIILPLHRQQEAIVQRMLNFLQPGTYVQPHLHPREFASETMFVLQGRMGFVLFSETGDVAELHDLQKGSLIDIEPQLWHGLVALEPDTVILEIKRGPYDDDDKVFADWAPAEEDESSGSFRENLEGLFESK